MDSAKFLQKLGIDFYKIASAEMTSHHLIQFVAEIGKPIILSTGACSLGEIERVLEIIYNTGNKSVALQHCVLSYPCKDEDANLEKMVRLIQFFPNIPVGYSDHTYGNAIPLAAIALGAKSIEKHYTVDKSLPNSPDHGFSMDPLELKEFVKTARRMEKAKGYYKNGPYEAEEKAFLYARKSIVTLVPVKKGIKLSKEMLSCKRPGTGIYPQFMDIVVGREVKKDIAADEVLTWDMI
jgi:sialic acid synthase SpsE